MHFNVNALQTPNHEAMKFKTLWNEEWMGVYGYECIIHSVNISKNHSSE